MAYIHSPQTINPSFPNPSYRFHQLPFSSPKHLFLPRKRPSISLTAADQRRILEAIIAESNEEEVLPGIRTYENNLARMTLEGAVDFRQALTAAAADGGRAADEHILAGLQTMVVETIFPGPPDENSTISTRLFLPAAKVKERVKNLKGFLHDDIISRTSENILSMTFRQVVLQQLWRFELVSFRPGTERNMDDLEKPREVPTTFAFSSSEERAIALLAEVICYFALEKVERQFYGNSFSWASDKFFNWFNMPKRIVSKDSSVILQMLLESEIVANAKDLLENFSSERFQSLGIKSNNCWWVPLSYSQLEKIGGPKFTAWAFEYLPLYRLQIDLSKLNDVKLEGGNLAATNIWEILLTHSQMVSLASILDMYYEDEFTLPNKQSLPDAVIKKSKFFKRKSSSSSLFKILSAALAGGLFLFSINNLSQLHLPSQPHRRKYINGDSSLQSSSIGCIQPESLGAMELEDYCSSVIRKLKDLYDWPGEIITEAGRYAWTGVLPVYLKRMVEVESMTSETSSSGTLPEERFEDIEGSIQDIASYQVVLSTGGKIVGFQPTSRVAVNYWAANPLAKELYGGRKLSPGLVEPRLKIHQPSDVVVLELLMSTNSEPHFALVRPVDISGMID